MANEIVPQVAAGANTLAESLAKVNQMQIDFIASMMKSSMDVFQTVSKMSFEVASNAINALNQALQDVAASIAPKS